MNKNLIIEKFLEIVKIGCASGDERGVADYMKSHLEALGCRVYEDHAAEKVGGNTGNLIAYLDGEIGGCLMLSAHLDRVNNGYNVKPSIEEGKIVSDGSTILAADNVSGLAVILDAVRRVKESGKKHVTVELVLSVCEENGIWGARVMDVGQLKSTCGYIFDSTGPFGQIDIKRPYKAMIDMTVNGKRAHGGSPEQGINAILAACQMLCGIREGRLDQESTSNIGVFHGGPKEPGTVCDKVSIRCEARSVSYDKLMDYIIYVKEYCIQHLEGTGASLDFQYEIQHGNCCFEPEDPLVKRITRELEAMDTVPILNLTMEGCDGNVYCAQGIPCISLGMGNEHAHSLNETASIDGLIKAGELAERLILSYSEECSGA